MIDYTNDNKKDREYYKSIAYQCRQLIFDVQAQEVNCADYDEIKYKPNTTAWYNIIDIANIQLILRHITLNEDRYNDYEKISFIIEGNLVFEYIFGNRKVKDSYMREDSNWVKVLDMLCEKKDVIASVEQKRMYERLDFYKKILKLRDAAGLLIKNSDDEELSGIEKKVGTLGIRVDNCCYSCSAHDYIRGYTTNQGPGCNIYKIYYNNYPVCEIFNSENDLNFNNSDYIRNRFVEGNWYDAFIRVMEEFKEEAIKREEYYHRKYGRH